MPERGATARRPWSAATRERLRCVALALLAIALGLAVHRGGSPKPAWRDVLGDALWAAMIAWWLGAAWPRSRLAARAALAYGVCVLVELSQRWHTPWLDEARGTTLGRLALGSGFDPRDLAAYAAGVAAALLIDHLAARRSRHVP